MLFDQTMDAAIGQWRRNHSSNAERIDQLSETFPNYDKETIERAYYMWKADTD